MSLRRPTVACSSFISCYKPFMRCRSDVRLWHALSLLSVISPLCGVAPTPDCGIIILHFPLEESSRHSFGTCIIYSAFSARGVFQTLVWHLYYYSAFSSRGVFQTLVWHQYYYSAVSARGVIQTLAWHPVFIISMSERTG